MTHSAETHPQLTKLIQQIRHHPTMLTCYPDVRCLFALVLLSLVARVGGVGSGLHLRSVRNPVPITVRVSINASDQKVRNMSVEQALKRLQACDKVDHLILLQKLYILGIKGSEHQWFKNYLNNWCCATVINNCKSQKITYIEFCNTRISFSNSFVEYLYLSYN